MNNFFILFFKVLNKSVYGAVTSCKATTSTTVNCGTSDTVCYVSYIILYCYIYSLIKSINSIFIRHFQEYQLVVVQLLQLYPMDALLHVKLVPQLLV
jgi:hypothetical protein